MLINYLKTATRALFRRRFFTAVSLFGITFTLTVLLVVSALVDNVLAPAAPEVNLGRTLHVSYLVLEGRSGERSAQICGSPGYGLLDGTVRDLPGVEKVSIYSTPWSVTSFVKGEKVVSRLRYTDGSYWEILDFDFLEGRPFTEEDEERADFVAVISRATRRRLFGDGSAAGETIEVDGRRYRVVGVVEDVPRTRLSAAADIWIPHSTAESQEFRREMMGDHAALLLTGPGADVRAIKAEFESRLGTLELSPPFDEAKGTAMTRLEETALHLKGTDDGMPPVRDVTLMILGMVAAFLLLPTMNLVSMNLARVRERSAEIGVRKTFGAAASDLVGQFIVENVFLCLWGGVLALAGAAGILAWIETSGLIPHAQLGLNYRVLLYALGLAVFLGLLSGVYPAWRTSRLHPVRALRGGD